MKTVRRPRTSKRPDLLVSVDTTQQYRIYELKATAKALPLQGIIEWNCQNWILDLISKLRQENVLLISEEQVQSFHQMEDRRRLKFESGRQAPHGSLKGRWIVLLECDWSAEFRNTLAHAV